MYLNIQPTAEDTPNIFSEEDHLVAEEEESSGIPIHKLSPQAFQSGSSDHEELEEEEVEEDSPASSLGSQHGLHFGLGARAVRTSD